MATKPWAFSSMESDEGGQGRGKGRVRVTKMRG